MEKFGRAIVKCRYVILAIAIALLIPSAMGYIGTRVNYDIMYYLPGEIDTMKGQDILMDEFGKGAYALMMVQDMMFTIIMMNLIPLLKANLISSLNNLTIPSMISSLNMINHTVASQ